MNISVGFIMVNILTLNISKRINKKMIECKNFFPCFLDWCSSSSRFLNNTNSYAVADKSVIILGGSCYIMLIMVLVFYFTLHKKRCLHFWYGLLVLGMFVGSSICNQWISSLTCRPIEMLYDKRFTSILGVQMISFIACVHLAYGLGSIFTPLFDQRRITLSTLDSHTPLFPSVGSIP